MASAALPRNVREKHSRACASRRGGRRCTCTPSYQGRAWVPGEQRRVARTFPTAREAARWVEDAEQEIATLPSGMTFRQAAERFRSDLLEGDARTSGGTLYAPSTAHAYSQALRIYAIPHFADRRLTDIRRVDVQRWIDQLGQTTSPTTGELLSAKSIANALHPARAVFRRAVRDDLIDSDPTRGVELPSVRSDPGRMRDPGEIAELLAALTDDWRPLYACACYAGLRRGELQALRWADVDLDAGLIHVRRSYYPRAHRFVPTKTRAGFRAVPIAPSLDSELRAHQQRTGRAGDDLVLGATPERPFDGTTALRAAKITWLRAGLEPIGIHEGRHVAASFMIAAGISLHEVSGYLGHASIQITADLYGHLVPGTQRRAADRLEQFLQGR